MRYFSLGLEAGHDPVTGVWRFEVVRDGIEEARVASGSPAEAFQRLLPQIEAAYWLGVAEQRPVPVFIDGLPTGCCCGSDCELPCFQRVGLTSEPCCERCAPLPSVDDEDTD